MLIDMAASPTLTGRGEVHRDRRHVHEFLAPRASVRSSEASSPLPGPARNEDAVIRGEV